MSTVSTIGRNLGQQESMDCFASTLEYHEPFDIARETVVVEWMVFLLAQLLDEVQKMINDENNVPCHFKGRNHVYVNVQRH